jgi:4-hydroxy-tetrahydrodipicolinate synthase
MLLDPTASGVYAIAVTPFKADGAVDYDSVDSMSDFYLRCGVTGLTILGIMGEAPKLDPAEALAISNQVVRRSKIPVIVGVSARGFAAMRSLARSVMEGGAAGVMIAPPPSLRTDDQIVSYYAQAVAAVGPDIPFVIQDYPLLLTVVMTPKVIQRIVNDNPSCVMLKHEDWPGLEKISALRKFQAEGSLRPISADGAMTGYAFPDMLVDVVRLQQSGQRDAAHDLFDAHLPLIRYEQQQGIGLAVRKYVLRKRGAIAHDAQRAPGSSLTAAARAEVDYLLGRLAQHDPRARN